MKTLTLKPQYNKGPMGLEKMFALTRFFPMLHKIRVYVNKTETNYSEQIMLPKQRKRLFSLRQLGSNLVAVAIEERCLVFERGSMTLHWKILNCFPP